VLVAVQTDRYLAAVAVLASIQAGHGVYLPPNLQPACLARLGGRPETCLILQDADPSGAGYVPALLAEPSGRAAPTADHVREWVLRSERAHPVTVFTSGTTADMTAHPKTLTQLLREVHTLGERFDVRAGQRVVGTVSPGHLYGLLFTVLLPLCRGAAFLRTTPLHAETVVAELERHEADILVTVPMHLRALMATDPGPLARLQRVFSSTAPLAAGLAEVFRTHHGQPIVEIFGSTETGGLAWRDQAQGSRWSPLPGVSLTADAAQQLVVWSPFLPQDAQPWCTADLAKFHPDGTFDHLGRRDGVVKIAGRRVSTQAVQEALQQHPAVEDAAVFAMPAGGGRGQKLLIVLTPATLDCAAIRAELLQRFHPSVIPRRLQSLAKLPRTQNGKLSRARLLEALDGAGSAHADRPGAHWSAHPLPPAEDGTQSYRVRLAHDASWFDGHFTNYPILAGAHQLQQLVCPAVERMQGHSCTPVELRRLKFSHRIQPGDTITVSVRPVPGQSAVHFELRTEPGGHLCFKGQLVLQ
jgi:acyl-coenzyme A synthetase/AMP-(fatty) acid ligase/3-hydroxymyristoyl/3-hydroxydecanoyl-(acyl carrier protein) dehydratase